jgi:hypothetical protein
MRRVKSSTPGRIVGAAQKALRVDRRIAARTSRECADEGRQFSSESARALWCAREDADAAARSSAAARAVRSSASDSARAAGREYTDAAALPKSFDGLAAAAATQGCAICGSRERVEHALVRSPGTEPLAVDDFAVVCLRCAAFARTSTLSGAVARARACALHLARADDAVCRVDPQARRREASLSLAACERLVSCRPAAGGAEREWEYARYGPYFAGATTGGLSASMLHAIQFGPCPRGSACAAASPAAAAALTATYGEHPPLLRPERLRPYDSWSITSGNVVLRCKACDRRDGCGPGNYDEFRLRALLEWEVDFELTRADYDAICGAGTCAYCPAAASIPLTSIGIDRLDYARGFETGNCVACCERCRLWKGAHSALEVWEYASAAAAAASQRDAATR